MDGIELDQPLPGSGLDQIDPFLLIHHWEKDIPGGMHPRDGGVGPHPHRGFSPVTFVFSGEVHHRDSRGNDSIVGPGGVQWMNAGMGIVHSERQSATFASKGGNFEIVQLWINTPSKHKLDQPEYYALQADQLPFLKLKGGTVKIVTGAFDGMQGPIKPKSGMLILVADLKEGDLVEIPVPTDFECIVYQLDGRINLCGEETTYAKNMTWFHKDGDGIALDCKMDGRALILCGKELGEEVAKYGPFVMNNQTEIMEAMRDFRMGRMGILIEEF